VLLCVFFLLDVVSLFVSASIIGCLERLVSHVSDYIVECIGRTLYAL